MRVADWKPHSWSLPLWAPVLSLISLWQLPFLGVLFPGWSMRLFPCALGSAVLCSHEQHLLCLEKDLPEA